MLLFNKLQYLSNPLTGKGIATSAIICDMLDTCQKFNKRSVLEEDIPNLKTNRQRLQDTDSGYKRLIYNENIYPHKYRHSNCYRWGVIQKENYLAVSFFQKSIWL